MLELHKMIWAPYVVECPISFFLFYERSCQRAMLKVMKKNAFLDFVAVWVLFPKILGRLIGDLCQNLCKCILATLK